ncbi:SCO family protein [Saliterribacillus persicus]|uniref:Protein SCO1/2 n=1 Tax=Saliterribacillus persicus TaxID=930114 RepID=A0A368XV60_9BACI|nr:SCO family protein [Saliterribacillus persicus]RCW71842.1 protein SCO1/2 [Saliterribacillus persicus]
MKHLKWVVLIATLLLAACGPKYEGDFSFEVQDFEYTNQDGESFSNSDLEGDFWVADMIFTNCDTVCPPMTVNMARLQKSIDEEGLENVQLVSFSIDPDNDTPEALKTFAEERGANFDNWNLLTDYSFDEIKTFALKSFKAPVDKIADSDQMLHTVYFYLVSPEGNAIKRYEGTKAEAMDEIVKDIKAMQ